VLRLVACSCSHKPGEQEPVNWPVLDLTACAASLEALAFLDPSYPAHAGQSAAMKEVAEFATWPPRFRRLAHVDISVRGDRDLLGVVLRACDTTITHLTLRGLDTAPLFQHGVLRPELPALTHLALAEARNCDAASIASLVAAAPRLRTLASRVALSPDQAATIGAQLPGSVRQLHMAFLAPPDLIVHFAPALAVGVGRNAPAPPRRATAVAATATTPLLAAVGAPPCRPCWARWTRRRSRPRARCLTSTRNP
jgi:hypothetical protein